MDKINLNYLLLFLIFLTLPGCEVIGGIFKAGFWVGIIVVVLVVAIVLWLIRKMRGPRHH